MTAILEQPGSSGPTIVTTPTLTPRELILQSCHALFAPGQVVELRMPKITPASKSKKFSAAGWFNDLEKLADAAADYDANKFVVPDAIYVTLNPVSPELLSRSENKVTNWQRSTTKDSDIIRRHWLPIDVDPVREANVSATDDQISAARDTARRVVAFVESEFGYAADLRAMSGNGFHVLCRVDLPNDNESRDIIRACLQVLDEKFSVPGSIQIDQTTYNAARIFKLWGTVARKGASSEERPHRRSRLLQTNGTWPVFQEVE